MPLYDCGDPECDECRREFGPDRKAATERYRQRAEAYERMERETRAATEKPNNG